MQKLDEQLRIELLLLLGLPPTCQENTGSSIVFETLQRRLWTSLKKAPRSSEYSKSSRVFDLPHISYMSRPQFNFNSCWGGGRRTNELQACQRCCCASPIGLNHSSPHCATDCCPSIGFVIKISTHRVPTVDEQWARQVRSGLNCTKQSQK